MKKTHLLSYSISILLLVLIGIKIVQIVNSNQKGIALEQEVKIQEKDIVLGESGEPIFMYFSYKCTYCRRFFEEVFPDLHEKYINTNKNQLVLKLIEPNNDIDMLNALQLLSCAAQYGKYNKLHELLLLSPNVVYKNEFKILIDDIVQQNSSIAECYFENNEYKYLKDNYAEYVTNNVTGTPAFIYKNKLYKGFHTLEELEKIITY